MPSPKKKSKLLIHICCAVCGASLVENLRNKWDIYLFFNGSNIHPEEEYEKRKQAVLELADIYNLLFIEEQYCPQKWAEAMKGLENEPEGGRRCEKCFQFLLKSTTKKVRSKNIPFFTTSLSASPHKNEKIIAQIGKNFRGFLSLKDLDVSKKENWLKTRELSKKYNFYRQNYCGCIFSKR